MSRMGPGLGVPDAKGSTKVPRRGVRVLGFPLYRRRRQVGSLWLLVLLGLGF